MKVWYKNEQNAGSVICYVVSVALVIGWVYMIFAHVTRSNAASVALPYVLFVIAAETIMIGFLVFFVFRCGQVVSIGVRNRRKWHEYLVKHGVKCNGYVIEVIEEKTRRASRDYTKYEYFFRVRYYSASAEREEEFVTTALSFRPKDRKKYICDVYETDEMPYVSEKQERKASYTFSLSPFKMLNAIEAKSRQEWFGNVVADGFREVAL